MTGLLHENEFSRKDFLKGSGALIVGFSMAGSALASSASAAAPSPAGYLPDVTQVDSWLSIGTDGVATLRTSQVEVGNGVTTGLLQVFGEELNLPMSMVRHAHWDTYQLVNSGSTGGSTGIQSSPGPAMRGAAAAAMQALFGLASTNLGVPVANLTASNGVISGGGKSVSYAALVGGQMFNTNIPSASASLSPGPGPLEAGQPVHARDHERAAHRHPGQDRGHLHLRPQRQDPRHAPRTGRPSAWSGTVRDRSDDRLGRPELDRAHPGCEGADAGELPRRRRSARIRDAIQAASLLKVTWTQNSILPTTPNLFGQMRSQIAAGQAVTSNNAAINVGSIPAGLAASAHTVAAEYSYQNGSRVPIGPACSVADVTSSSAIVYCSSQQIMSVVTGVAQLIGLPAPQVRVYYYEERELVRARPRARRTHRRRPRCCRSSPARR